MMKINAEQHIEPKKASLRVALVLVSILAVTATLVAAVLYTTIVKRTSQEGRSFAKYSVDVQNDVSNNDIGSDKIYSPGADCGDILKTVGPLSGVYKIQPEGASAPFSVYCEMTDSGAWTVIQRRQDGSVSFIRNWADYKEGFGNINGEYWIGNDNIHYLTKQAPYKLRIDLGKGDGLTAYAEYNTFVIEDEYNNYTLHLGENSGTAGDSLIDTYTTNNGMPFSTFDNDNDQYIYNCASNYYAGWWFNHCTDGNLNGFYYTTKQENYHGTLNWFTWNLYEPLKSVTMKLQQVN
ncbi:fibrinogen-like protein 1 [Saccoglossus kowalevskii]|uniref:Fibrinogen-like protein 1-like n=1 Tax=Saccoglossus kowalevskii TaxID=10224 RepID=A0ABM0MGG6_SACKO|nr:PREDICTED: fibrinogen-like protein 1-like [Saccoglossus kowalevskii]